MRTIQSKLYHRCALLCPFPPVALFHEVDDLFVKEKLRNPALCPEVRDVESSEINNACGINDSLS